MAMAADRRQHQLGLCHCPISNDFHDPSTCRTKDNDRDLYLIGHDLN
jgi:hypothetical protein